MIDQIYVETHGFKKDETCPIGVNRWKKQVGEGWNKEYWVSVTLSNDGKETLYGVINFYAINNTGSRPYDYISEHRYFNGPISITDFNRFLNKQEKWANRINIIMIKITYHSDKDCRKGCHPVTYTDDRDKRYPIEVHICSIDEPGAWFDDKWNCHVDGTDYPMNSRENAIIWGLYVHGILDFEEEQERKDLRKLIKK